MFYLGKILQATGLTVVLIGFIQHFPNLMPYRYVLIGILMFISGWLILNMGRR